METYQKYKQHLKRDFSPFVSDVTDGYFKEHVAGDCEGNDIESFQSNILDCLSSCHLLRDCVAVIHNPQSSQCFMKRVCELDPEDKDLFIYTPIGKFNHTIISLFLTRNVVTLQNMGEKHFLFYSIYWKTIDILVHVAKGVVRKDGHQYVFHM